MTAAEETPSPKKAESTPVKQIQASETVSQSKPEQESVDVAKVQAHIQGLSIQAPVPV